MGNFIVREVTKEDFVKLEGIYLRKDKIVAIYPIGFNVDKSAVETEHQQFSTKLSPEEVLDLLTSKDNGV